MNDDFLKLFSEAEQFESSLIAHLKACGIDLPDFASFSAENLPEELIGVFFTRKSNAARGMEPAGSPTGEEEEYIRSGEIKIQIQTLRSGSHKIREISARAQAAMLRGVIRENNIFKADGFIIPLKNLKFVSEEFSQNKDLDLITLTYSLDYFPSNSLLEQLKNNNN